MRFVSCDDETVDDEVGELSWGVWGFLGDGGVDVVRRTPGQYAFNHCDTAASFPERGVLGAQSLEEGIISGRNG